MSTLKTNNIQHVDRSEPSILIDTSGSVSIAGTLTYEDVTNVDSVGIITARGLNIFGNTTGLQVASGISTFQAVTGTTGTFSDNVQLNADTKFLQIGASQDLDLHHNGTNSYIRNKTGDLHIRPLVAEEGIILKPNGAVELYHDNSKKIETTSAGGTLTGDFTFTGNIYAGNHISILDSDGASDMLKIGTSEDLRIYHYNNSSYIRQHTDKPLYIGGTSTGQSLYIQPKDGENSAIFKPNGAVELYWDNSKKFETYQYGIKTTQNIMIGTHAYWEDNGEAIFGDGSDLKIYHASNIDKIESSGAGLHIRQINNGDVHIHAGADSSASNNRLVARSAGAAELYHSGTKKFETGGSYNYIYGIASGNPAGLVVRNTNTASDYDHGSLRLESRNNAAYGTVFTDKANASLRLGYDTTGNTFNVFNDGTVRAAGMKFGSDTAVANTLDDYEEGTWTLTTAGGTVNNIGTTSGRTVKYTRIGNVVYFAFDIYQVSNNMEISGTVSITGLPFGTLPDQFHSHVSVGIYKGTGANINVKHYINNSPHIVLIDNGSITGIRHLWGQGFYFTST